MKRGAVTFVLILLSSASLLPLSQGWGNDALQEPSSRKHDTSRYVWQTPNDKTQMSGSPPQVKERIYFNGQLSFTPLARHANVYVPFAGQAGVASPTGRLSTPTMMHADALLGYWRDCNNDGYIGNGLTGQKTYLASATVSPVDLSVCPLGSLYNPGTCTYSEDPMTYAGCLAPNLPYNQVKPLIHEFIDIGDDGRYRGQTNLAVWRVDDPQARVWADLGLPGTPREQYFSFRDLIAENPPQLFFAPGTFDSWDGHIRQVDFLTFHQVSETAKNSPARIDIYNTPVESLPSPLRMVRYQGYSAGGTHNGYDGEPMVALWHCPSPSSDPTLQPSFNPNGSVGDSVNESIRGVAVHQTVTPPVGQPTRIDVDLSTGCANYDTGSVFHEGLFLPHMEDETISTSVLKDTPDMFFQYRPPLNEPRNQLAAWGVVPRADRTTGGTWYAHQIFVNNGFDARRTQYVTFYASVGNAGTQRGGLAALPSGQADVGVYGAEYCINRPTPNPFGWNCSAAAWEKHRHHEWGVPLFQAYDLRDVDCTDFTPLVLDAWTDVRGAVDQTSVDVMGARVFDAYCE